MTDWYEMLIKNNRIFFQYRWKNRIFPAFLFFFFLFLYGSTWIEYKHIPLLSHFLLLLFIFTSGYLSLIEDRVILDLQNQKIIKSSGLIFIKKSWMRTFEDIEIIKISDFFFRYKKKRRYEIIINLKNDLPIKIGNFKDKKEFQYFTEKFSNYME